VDGHRLDDIRARGAVNLKLDDERVELTALEGPVAAMSPYRNVAPVGQTAYFTVDVALLKRMASSRKLVLNVRAGDLTMIDFNPLRETRAELQQFLVARSIADE
jgi:hypothetical protein